MTSNTIEDDEIDEWQVQRQEEEGVRVVVALMEDYSVDEDVCGDDKRFLQSHNKNIITK